MKVVSSKMSRFNVLNVIVKRGYVTAPQAATCSGKIDISTLPNKTIVTSMGCGPKKLVKVAVGFKAGSRYETFENYGASHILRRSAGLSTGCASSFAIHRNLQQIGASLTTISDRETVLYILESSCNNLNTGLQYLKYLISKQEFRPWELSDNVPVILNELAVIPPQAKVLDLLHRAAFRTGLGNSIFAQVFNVKKIGSETLQHFACSHLVGSKAAIAGCGISHNSLSEFAEDLNLPQGSAESGAASKYYGGEIRVEESLPLVHTVIAGEAPGLSSAEVLASAVAKYALGTSPAIKYGASAGPLGKISGSCSAASAFSVAHSDAGLLGVYIAARPSEAKQAVEGAVKVLKSGVSDQDVERGKAQLKSAILFSAGSCQGIVEDLAGQSLLCGCPKSPFDLAEEVSKVTASQVNQVLQKAAGGKKSLAVIGSTSNVPYLDEL